MSKYVFPNTIFDLGTHYAAFISGWEDKQRIPKGDEKACVEIKDETYKNNIIKWKKYD